MRIPKSRLDRFAADLIAQCLVSRTERIHRGITYKNVFLTGDESGDAAIFNKTYCYLDDLESLLYSPVGLRLNIVPPGSPSPNEQAKGRAASADLHGRMRQSGSDSMISDAVLWSLVKGKALVKLLWDREGFAPTLIQPEMMGVMQENLNRLDENMEAFVHSTYITPYQFERMIYNRSASDKAEMMKKAKKYLRPPRADDPKDESAMKQIIIGGLYPYQAQGSSTPNNTRGIVDWMSGPAPTVDPKVLQSMMRLDELWVWNDEQEDWSTFQMIGDDMMVFGKDYIANAFAFDLASKASNPVLKGHHPFTEFCPNRIDGYFWGRSEIQNVALLQIAINSRINGINGLLRMQEDPPKKFTGTSGVNQLAISRLSRPGGYFSDSNPNAKVENMTPELNQDLFQSLHEYERMFDEMGGLPPIAKGMGESGVRSQGHAETLVRMFSPRFKDRALLVERDVESFGGLALDLCKAHVPKKLTAWVNKGQAGVEGGNSNELDQAPSPNMEAIEFIYKDIDEDSHVTVDSHSSSPAFAMEARSLVFDLFKIGAMDVTQVIEHTDSPDPEGLIAGVERRQAAQAAFLEAHPEAATKGKKKK